MKKMTLIALLAATLNLQTAYAGKKVDMVKKGVKICWYTVQIVSGSITDFLLVAESITDYRKNTLFKTKKDMLTRGLLLILGSSTLGAGIRGLNHELKISERTKRLWHRIKS